MTFKSLAFATVAGLGLLAGGAHAEDLVFTLTNHTDATIVRFYTSPTGVNNWEEDVLGDDVLGPGESVDITIADGRTVCDYDMRFEFDEDDNLKPAEDTANLCETGSYTLEN